MSIGDCLTEISEPSMNIGDSLMEINGTPCFPIGFPMETRSSSMPSIVIPTDFLGVPMQIEDVRPISIGNRWGPMLPVHVFRSPGVGAVMFAPFT